MPHLALLGDASLANGRYTAPEPDTATQVQQQLPDWTVTLLAAGGATMAEIPAQLQRFPAGVDLAVLSVGGNVALEHVGLLQQPSKSSSDTLDALHRMVQEFSEKYDKVVPVLSRLAGRVLLCTIYEAPLVGENTASRARVVLRLLNDYILRTAARGGWTCWISGPSAAATTISSCRSSRRRKAPRRSVRLSRAPQRGRAAAGCR